MDDTDKARVCARTCAIFNITDVYDWQLEVAEAVLARKDVILGVPTGGGKTLAFYLPLLHSWTLGDHEPGHQEVILVVSPLVELMQEQATDLNSKGIPAVVMCAETMTSTALRRLCKLVLPGPALTGDSSMLKGDEGTPRETAELARLGVLGVCSTRCMRGRLASGSGSEE